ncbi:carboxylesterase family protein [Aquabacterium sp. A7-Y]|uniref:carboxylesterase/lipase family protein n=1 Tax=Aquabacterium sp. A7-Y TaxID=1349605 RepID=UPI00223CD830|nr:carboxylesterase/lipase family protein [Aquabacterium sp. A7-Y]MCW7537337.1 carboxylesterase family protein [Aquabacterium sp. A7-Y]
MSKRRGNTVPAGFRLAGMMLAAGLALSGCGGSDDDEEGENSGDATRVETRAGTVQGSETNTTRAWLGIPYGAPPSGERRWRAPEPAAAWSGVRPATVHGPHCPQPDTAPLQYGTPGGQEDCLYLNVYAPRSAGPHPVMVWIHGGAFYLGRSNGYDPTRLVEQGIVVVTLNYRLGALGFLAHPALNDAEGRSGNYALMDQQLALRWVQDNIAAFGGDPGQVTVAGQSAGGSSVVAHLVSPDAAGLFQRAIVQSGGYQRSLPTGEQAQVRGVQAAEAMGCPDGPGAAACLRALPVDTLIAKQPRSHAPNVDGALLPRDPASAWSSGQFNQVPVLTGSTHDEYTVFQYNQSEMIRGPLAPEDYPAAVAAAVAGTPVTAADALVLYPLSAYDNSPGLALSALVTDASFACGGRRLAQALAEHVPVYAYEFDDRDAPMSLQPPASFPYKAYHAAEIQYLFDVPTAAGQELDAAQRRLAQEMVERWARFVRGGNPNVEGATAWPAYGAGDRYWRFKPDASTVFGNFAADHHCEAWTPGER